MYSARYIKHTLRFHRPATTSRGVLNTLDTWYLILIHRNNPGIAGIGECPVLPGLSKDDHPGFETKLQQVCKIINSGLTDLKGVPLDSPGIRFALETASLDLEQSGLRILFPSPFTRGEKGIHINGLIWMGNTPYINRQIKEKLRLGFRVLKLKVGVSQTPDELEILAGIRRSCGLSELEIRLDANGAWEAGKAVSILEAFSAYGIHSVEQPIPAGSWEEMAELCRFSPVPIALDEELIGISDMKEKKRLLSTIRPQYLVLKPGLLGGFSSSREWIDLAQKENISWWITSALESNIGLNAIAQWTATLNTEIPQGLGTGSLFSNNIPSPLEIRSDRLFYDPAKKWELKHLLNT